MKTSVPMILGLTAVLSAGCGTVVRPGQVGIKYHPLRTPALQDKVQPEGFYWQFPWNDIVRYDVVWQSKTEPVEILTADQLHVTTKVTVTFRPEQDRLLELARTLGPDYYAGVIRPAFVTISRSEFSRHVHNKLAEESSAIEESIFAKLSGVLAGKPVVIDRISIDHIDYDAQVTRAISTKIATEQLEEQKRLEVKVAQQEAEIIKTRAKAQADATVIQGEGQARAQAAINKTLTPAYLRYKAFDNPSTRYYFVPVGKDGLPIIVNTEDMSR